MARETQNAAILFADICDSTSLYQELGDAAGRNVVNACLAVIMEVVPRHQGRVVMTVGDAALCLFPSADQSVLAASDMQSVVASTRPGNFPATIHIGLHYGPVLVEEGDVFGDTVNVAAYLTAVAMSEQILATEVARQSLSAALGSCVRPIFNTVLKGSERETIVYQILWRPDRIDLTDVNDQARKLIPGDTGSLLVSLDEERVRIDQWCTGIVIGRDAECDLVVAGRYASRAHVDRADGARYVPLRGRIHRPRPTEPAPPCAGHFVGRLGHAPRPRCGVAWCGTGRGAACSCAIAPGLPRLLPQTGLRLTRRSRLDMPCAVLRVIRNSGSQRTRVSLG